MPRQVGSGVALFDFDGDGLLDIYVIQNGGPKGPANRLYRQRPDHTFEDVSKGSGLDVAGWGMGVAAGDIDNDGRIDLALFEYGRTRLFRNLGNGRFADVSKASGIANPLWAVSGAFVDYDRDGWLDLVIANYLDYDPSWPCRSPGGRREFCGPTVFRGTANRLYRNLGRIGSSGQAAVRFEDVSVSSGIAGKPGPSLGVHCADFSGDGWPDILFANDQAKNHLWVNQRNGSFREEAVSRGLAYDGFGNTQADMGIALGDVDGNGLFDVLITHLTNETHTLWLQESPGVFSDHSGKYGLAVTRGTGFGLALADFDLDGQLDLAVATGRVQRRSQPAQGVTGEWAHYAEHNQLLRFERNKFVDVSQSETDLCKPPDMSRGMALGDIDNDGRPDLVVMLIDSPPKLLWNRAPRKGSWLTVRAVDPALHRDAFGAVVRVRAGRKSWMRLIQSAGSYASANDPRAFFGLGDVRQIDSVEVLWPDGLRESFRGIAPNRVVTLKRGSAESVRSPKAEREREKK
jgi:enediyne biosynthesis protein E4